MSSSYLPPYTSNDIYQDSLNYLLDNEPVWDYNDVSNNKPWVVNNALQIAASTLVNLENDPYHKFFTAPVSETVPIIETEFELVLWQGINGNKDAKWVVKALQGRIRQYA